MDIITCTIILLFFNGVYSSSCYASYACYAPYALHATYAANADRLADVAIPAAFTAVNHQCLALSLSLAVHHSASRDSINNMLI